MIKKLHRRDSISPVKYGIDKEVADKMQEKYDHTAEEEVMDWIESVTGEPIDDFYTDLHSGVVLCRLINAIWEGRISKIHTKETPAFQRENIQKFINKCEAIGLKKSDLFNVNDLYEEKDLGSVVKTLKSLQRRTKGLSERDPLIPKAGGCCNRCCSCCYCSKCCKGCTIL